VPPSFKTSITPLAIYQHLRPDGLEARLGTKLEAVVRMVWCVAPIVA
jgi:hypothetical protein